MTTDASFQDGAEQAVRLVAATTDDLAVISALAQDAVCKVGRIQYMPRLRRFSFMLYRFRWEDKANAEKQKRQFERVSAALIVDDVMGVKATGVDQSDPEFVFNILGLDFAAGEDGSGAVTIRCSGGTTFIFKVEALNITLTDLTQPWAAAAAPKHED
ncbi:MAG: DUF2948 family protein [Pikeienuella sp.]